MSIKNHCAFMSIFLCSILFIGCDFESHHLDGPYYLTAVDVTEDMNLSYQYDDTLFMQRVPPTVFAAGWNENVVVVKQRNYKNKNIYFYVLDRKKDGPSKDMSDCVTGPLTADQYSALGKTMKLPEFTMVIRKLEPKN